MIGKRLLGLLVLAMAIMCGPAFAGDPPADVKPSPDVAWLVIGIQPPNAQIEIARLRMKGGVISNSRYRKNYRPSDGFILVKATPGETYGITGISLFSPLFLVGAGGRYSACGQVPIFQSDGGKVVYFTTIAYTGTNRVLFRAWMERPNFSLDINGAKAFLKAHYPGLADSVEQGSYAMMPMGRRCG